MTALFVRRFWLLAHAAFLAYCAAHDRWGWFSFWAWSLGVNMGVLVGRAARSLQYRFVQQEMTVMCGHLLALAAKLEMVAGFKGEAHQLRTAAVALEKSLQLEKTQW